MTIGNVATVVAHNTTKLVFFYHEGKEYEYRSYCYGLNTENFVKEVLGIEFEEVEDIT